MRVVASGQPIAIMGDPSVRPELVPCLQKREFLKCC